MHEDLPERLFDAVGKLIGPVPLPKFTHQTVRDIYDQIHRRYVGYPTRIRLDGMHRDLTESEKLTMAHFEATVEILNRLGVLDMDRLQAILPAPFTAGHEVLDEGVVGHNFTPQK